MPRLPWTPERFGSDGDVVATADVEVTGPNPKIELKGNAPIDVGFGRKPWIVPNKALEDMMNAVATLIEVANRQWFDGDPLWPAE